MISKRLSLIASFLNKNDRVLDVGTDHALLPVYLMKNDLVEKADGSDISEKVLFNAKNNIDKYDMADKVNLYLSDGVKSVNINEYNTLVISGMGFFTIKHILEEKKLENINKMIIQTNNHYTEFRDFVTNSIGFKIVSENYICDSNKDYLIFYIEKGFQDLTDEEIICGIYNKDNIIYYEKQIRKLKELLRVITNKEKIKLIDNMISTYKKYVTTEKTEEKM